MLIHRRGLIGGLGALFAAPAIVRATSLMPIKALEIEPLWTPISPLEKWQLADLIYRIDPIETPFLTMIAAT